MATAADGSGIDVVGHMLRHGDAGGTGDSSDQSLSSMIETYVSLSL